MLGGGKTSPRRRSHLALLPGIGPCDFTVESSLNGQEGLPGEEKAHREGFDTPLPTLV